MYCLSVKNSKGECLNLSHNKEFAVRAEGLNSQTANINSTKTAGADGSKKNSASLNEKNIVFYIKLFPPVEVNRNRLYKFFTPKSDIRIFYKNSLLDVYIDGTVDTFNCETFTNNEVAQISILCNDPYFKATADTKYSFTNIAALFQFPFAIAAEGVPFSETTRITNMLVNNGDVESGLVIEFHATTSQILNPSFYNLTTQKYITLNFDMLQGDTIRINTNKNHKSITLIRNGAESNILNCLSAGSNIGLTLTTGENEIAYDSDEGQTNLNCEVITTAKYTGV